MKRSDYYFTRSITTGYVYGIYQKIDGQLVKEGDVTTSTMIRSNKTMESVITEYFKSLGEILEDVKNMYAYWIIQIHPYTELRQKKIS